MGGYVGREMGGYMLVAHLLASPALWISNPDIFQKYKVGAISRNRKYNEEVSSGRLRFSVSKLYTTVCLFVCPAPRCIPAHTADAPLLRVNRSRTHAP
jgi:hypothetical protein